MKSFFEILNDSWMITNRDFDFLARGENELQATILRLRSRWNESIEVIIDEIPGAVLSGNTSKFWFKRICDFHSDSGRHYHTLCHLEEMFGYVDLMLNEHERNQTNDEEVRGNYFSSVRTNGTAIHVYKAIIAMSVFFHDAVYDPKSVRNEEDSVDLFRQFVQELLDAHREIYDERSVKSQNVWFGFDRIENFILATKSHNANDVDIEQNEKIYLNIFLDADMAVLGKSHEAYLHYASLIRKEFAHVPHNIYCKKRADVLKSFIANDVVGCRRSIFLDKQMRDALEERAVENLKIEIEFLRRGQIPGDKNDLNDNNCPVEVKLK